MRINFNIQKNKALKGRKEEIRHENQEKEKKKRKEKKNESLKPHKSYIIPTHHWKKSPHQTFFFALLSI